MVVREPRESRESRGRRSTRRALASTAKFALLAALIAVVAVAVVREMHRPATTVEPIAGAPSAGSEMPALFSDQATVLVITDSLGNPPSELGRAYPELLGEKLGCDVAVDALGARGFLPTDLTSIGVDRIVPPFIDKLEETASTFSADYVVVDGGRNDLGKDPRVMIPAVEKYLTALREHYPNAEIFVVSPMYVTPYSSELYPMISDGMRRAAERINAHVMDPVGERWYSNIDLAPLLVEDGFHLSQQGADFYAQKIADDMRKMVSIGGQ